MPLRPFRRASLYLALLAFVFSSSGEALGDIPDLWWRLPEVVDSNVPALSTSSGASGTGALGRWWVVYEKNGDIYCADRDTSGGGWRITPLATGSGIQTEPHITAGDQVVYAIWEDRGGPHPEVWTRRFVLNAWDPARCLSCDGISSRHPVIDVPRWSSGDPYVAWEDSTGAGFRIMARSYSGPTQQVSSSTADPREPSVCAAGADGGVVWTDYRFGIPQIYRWTGGPAEERVTVLPFPCRRAQIRNEVCSEFGFGPPRIVFEGDPHDNGIAEVYAARCDGLGGADLISADDGVSSIAPNIDAFRVDHWPCYSMPYTSATYLMTWTDLLPGGSQHWMDEGFCCGPLEGNDLLPAAGRSRSAVCVAAATPHAGALQLWIEDQEGVPTLMAREGRLPGCDETGLGGPRAFLVVPGGIPGNLFRLYNICSGEPAEYGMVTWMMDSRLDASLTWDAQQSHGDAGEVNADGEVTFGVSAGGCSQAGGVRVWSDCMFSLPEVDYDGAKSPDVDGDCEVGPGDLAYVESKVGTSDFCADLDGSGVVGAEDVAIVQATLGQHCSNVPADADAAMSLPTALRVFPNPCRERVTFEAISPAFDGSVRVEVYDAGGRRIRSIESAAGSTLRRIAWDLREESGRAAPAGIYFVIARIGAESRRQVLVVY